MKGKKTETTMKEQNYRIQNMKIVIALKFLKMIRDFHKREVRDKKPLAYIRRLYLEHSTVTLCDLTGNLVQKLDS